MSKLLLPEQPLVILPMTAKIIGLNEAIILQQVHYWLLTSKHKHDGFFWIYNTYIEWQKQFPFWSKNTVRRTIKSLEKKELLVVGNYNKIKIDQTKWYRIDYSKLDQLAQSNDQLSNMDRPSAQYGQTQSPNMDKAIPETTRDYNRESTPTATFSILGGTPEDNVQELKTKKQNQFGGDPLSDVVNGQDQIDTTTAPNPEDQWFEYRNEFISIFHNKTRRYPNDDEKSIISELASEQNASPEKWEQSLTECNLNYTGHKLPVSRPVEVYRAGGTWDKWKAVAYGDKNGAKKPKPTPTPIYNEAGEQVGTI